MMIILTWFVRICAAVAALLLAGIGVVYFLFTRSLPDYSGNFEVQGVNGPVQIVRDQHGIPHIYGNNDEDVYFGLAFAHAQDRLWQMMMLRSSAYGRLSETFGTATLDHDELMRRFDIHELSRASYDTLDEETKAALDAYARGVNAWLQIVDDSLLNGGAPEFLLFDFPIRPWQRFDSIAIQKLIAADLSFHADDEALRFRLARRIPPERVLDLMPSSPEGFPAQPHSEEISLLSGANRPDGVAISRPAIRRATGGKGGGSNMWAVGPGRAKGDASILASDPHLGLTAPSIWMLARLELSNGGAIGATIPGSPLMPLGRSASIAWAITSSHVDDQDLYFEQLDPTTDSRYLTPEGSREFRRRLDVIDIKGEVARTIELRWTENGPVIPAKYFGLEDILPHDQVLSLAWTMLSGADASIAAGLRLMNARTVDEALEAAQLHRSPQLNLLVVGESDMAMQTVGSVPRRSQFHDTQGRRPASGSKWRNRWQGEIEYSALPRFRNPANGVLANTNNRIVDRPCPDNLSHSWGDSQRILRLDELLAGQDVHTRNSFAAIQLDAVSYTARALIPLLARELWHTVDMAPEGETERLRNSAVSLLQSWNGEMGEYRPEPLIFAAWLSSVQNMLIRDDIGALADEFRNPDPLFLERVFRDIDGASAWCDISATQVAESCHDIAVLALDQALSHLAQEFGSDVQDWQWSKAHVAHHDHLALADSRIMSWLFNIRQPAPGGGQTINKISPSWDEASPFTSRSGPGYRAVYDFSDPDASQFVISTGQSGHPLSRHYDDLSKLWKSGNYVTMSLDPLHARAVSAGTVHLEPAAPE